ncbi:MAG: DNA translocase FtsK [Coriobacteriales bacterium]|nr:DNA translocase FtsK [Coriobacteriales bacterium]
MAANKPQGKHNDNRSNGASKGTRNGAYGGARNGTSGGARNGTTAKRNAKSSHSHLAGSVNSQARNSNKGVADTQQRSFLDNRAKNDLAGVLIAILAIVLLVVVLMPSNAIAAHFISEGLRVLVGLGAYILPFLLLCWATTFFIKQRLTNSPMRLLIGLAVIYLAIISLASANGTNESANLSQIFLHDHLIAGGGYIGGCITWALLTLVGGVPTTIILVGLILAGLVLIGFSISKLIENLGNKVASRKEGKAQSNPQLAQISQGAYQMSADARGKNTLGHAACAQAQLQPTIAVAAKGRKRGLAGMQTNASTTSELDALYGTAYEHGSQGEIPYNRIADLGATRRLRNANNGANNKEGRDDLNLYAANGLDGGFDILVGDYDEDASNQDVFDYDLDADGKGNGVFGSNAGASSGSDIGSGMHSDTNADMNIAQNASESKDGRGKNTSDTKGKRGKSGLLAKGTSLAKGVSNSDIATASNFEDDFILPDAKILRVSREKATTKAGIRELRNTAERLQATFEEFGVDGKVIGWISGPTVTLYKVTLGEGVRLNRVTGLQDDIQLSLAALAIRIVAPIPGTSLVGIEVPNDKRNDVLLGDVLSFASSGALQLGIGKDVEGDAITADLAAMPHLLIGGTTGSGKSVAINSMIMSILMRATPNEVRMILIDPKRVELSLYNDIPHLYVPVVTDAAQAASALSWAVAEMELRLKSFQKSGVKNIKQYNAKAREEQAKREAELQKLVKQDAKAEADTEADRADTGTVKVDMGTVHLSASTFDSKESTDEQLRTDEPSPCPPRTDEPSPCPPCPLPTPIDAANIASDDNCMKPLPYIVIVIDELADLMMVAGKDVEASISRLAQLARAAGLHLIVATQRPSTQVITGLIKANIVNRIAFTVASGIDSRVILDNTGAEDLIGGGDLLFARPEYSKPVRIQGCFVSEPEIETVVEFWRSQGTPDYHEDILLARNGSGGVGNGGFGDENGDDDPLLWDAADIVVSSGLGSTSTLQRRLKVGYARAGRIMDMLESKGIVGPPNGSKPREVLIDDVLDLETLKAFER